jgi:LPS export ABC transporter permease LptG
VKILDRYVIRSFLEPFFLCTFGFLAIWLIFDVSDNIHDFIEAKASLKAIGGFYLTQLPAIILLVLPVGLLLALLFSLSKMSRTNELIAQLTAGRSVFRILLPLFGVGLLCTAGLWALGQELAPHADAIKKVALDQMQKRKRDRDAIEAHLFRDRLTLRNWYIRKLRKDSPILDNVDIVQQNDEGKVVQRWHAERADWKGNGQWTFSRGWRLDFDAEGQEKARDSFLQDTRVVQGWTETPWRIASSNFEPQNLSVPELNEYILLNQDFPRTALAPFRTYLEHRQAMPWTCLVVVLIAAPLGIVFNRRGVLAGVAGSIFIFFGMIFTTNLFLALGKGDRVTPWIAAWLPNLVIGTIGIYLLWSRNSNRDLPSIFPKKRRR